MNKEKSDEQITRFIKELNEEYVDGTVKEIEVPPLINMKTGKQIGNAVIIYLSNKYDYSDEFLNFWKEKLGAISYSVSANRNRLKIKYIKRY